jgi:NAD(P)-dependent dehydrogenase (short-subunit alcohol dehydrogenase family)
MRGKVVVITGATSGIGKVAAEKLAAMGARLVLVARDKSRGEAALAQLHRMGPGVSHSIHYADLSRISEMKRVAAEIAAAEPQIDVLINNAGALFASRHVTEDGFDRLRASALARIINTSSDAHNGKMLDFGDLQSSNGYRGFQVYGRSKLCNILYTRELARRLTGTGVTANTLHPGFVATRFGDESGGLLSFGVRFAKYFAISPEKGAETIVYLASSPDVAGVTGQYFYKCKPAVPSRQAQDDQAAARLWSETEKLAGMQAQSTEKRASA